MTLTTEQKKENRKKQRAAWLKANPDYYKNRYKKNKEKIDKQNSEWRKNNKEKIKECAERYNKTEKGKMCNRIKSWKYIGLITNDYEELYLKYLAAKNCDFCGVLFGGCGDGSGTFKNMDHNHETGEFRNFLCSGCNTRRG